jgi:2-methylcitrate dehydratase PrpD
LERYPAAAAALVNGTLAHSLDFDDTHLPSVLHPSSSVVPAALATAEAQGRNGAETLAAIAVGDELCVRIGAVGYDAERRANLFFERGLHATSICGTLAAAGTAAFLLGLDVDGVAAAIGIAASMGAGLLEANRTGGSVKRIHCGWAAHAGVTAAELARAGLTGPPTVLEGRFGFFQAYCGHVESMQALTDGLGERWEVLSVSFKPYPCNHFTHPGIDAALRLRADGLDPADIAALELGVPAAVLRTIGEPLEEKVRPRSGYHAAFSGPFTVASALLGGGGLGLYLDDFTDERARDPHLLDLAGRVRCVPDAECDRIFPQRFAARLRARTRSGEEHEVFVGSSRGGPGHPLTDDELQLKFDLNASRRLPRDQVDALRALVLGFDRAASPAALLETAAPRTPALR